MAAAAAPLGKHLPPNDEGDARPRRRYYKCFLAAFWAPSGDVVSLSSSDET